MILSKNIIIFGISDDGSIIGLKILKKQTNIIHMFGNTNFADDMFPDITLEDLAIDDKNISNSLEDDFDDLGKKWFAFSKFEIEALEIFGRLK